MNSLLQGLLTQLQKRDADFDAHDLFDLVWLAAHSERPAERPAPEQPQVPRPTDDNRPPNLPPFPPTSEDKSKQTTPQPDSPVTPPGPATEAFAGRPGDTGARPMQPVSLAGSPAIAGRLDFDYALRPLRRLRPSRTRVEIDEEATVESIAETRLWSVKSRPIPERWLDITLVVERSSTMRLWQDTGRELREILARGCRARTVSLCYLDRQPEGLVLTSFTGRRLPLRFAPPPGSNHLILLLSDCFGVGWLTAEIPQLLRQWATRQPTAVLQTLPPHLWRQTSLRTITPRRATTREHPATTTGDKARPFLVQLTPGSLARFSDFLANLPGSRAQIIDEAPSHFQRITPEQLAPQLDQPAAKQPPLTEPEIQKRYENFIRFASPQAVTTARYIAGVPLVLPVMRLVQRTLIRDHAPWQLAEIFQSGLLRRAESASTPWQYRETDEFAFLPGIREKLMEDGGLNRQFEVIDLLSRYLEQRFGKGREFLAWISAETTAEKAAEQAAAAVAAVDNTAAHPGIHELGLFARISREHARRLGIGNRAKTPKPEPIPAPNPQPKPDRPRYTVMIGGTLGDLLEHRGEAIQVCLDENLRPITTDSLAPTIGDSRELINRADIYLAIILNRQGWASTEDEISLTEMELDQARARGLPILTFLMPEDYPYARALEEADPGHQTKLAVLRRKATAGSITAEFRSLPELRSAITRALRQTVAELQSRPGSGSAAETATVQPPPRRFRVAFSFAEDKREHVSQVAHILAIRFGEDKILYDQFHQAEFARPDLAFHMPTLYRDADLIVSVLSAGYLNRTWARFELEAINGLIDEGKVERLLYARFDKSAGRELEGFSGFVELDDKTPAQTAALILERLAENEGQPRDFYRRPGWPSMPPDFDWKDDAPLEARDSFWHLIAHESPFRLLQIRGNSRAGKTSLLKQFQGNARKTPAIFCTQFNFRDPENMEVTLGLLSVGVGLSLSPSAPIDQRCTAIIAALGDIAQATLLLFNNYDRASESEKLAVELFLSALPTAPWLRIVIAGKEVADPQGKPWEYFAAPLIELEGETPATADEGELDEAPTAETTEVEQPPSDPSAKRFRVAFPPFAEQKREYVARLAQLLADQFGKDRIFYDRFHEDEYGVTPTPDVLALYKQCDLIVPVLSSDNANSPFSNLDRQFIGSVIQHREAREVLLARFDEVEYQEFLGRGGFVDLDGKTPEQAVTFILERLALNEGKPRTFYTSRPRLDWPDTAPDLDLESINQVKVADSFQRLILSQSPYRLLQIRGAKGTGKSHILQQFFRNAHEIPGVFCTQFNFRNSSGRYSEFATIAKLLGVSPPSPELTFADQSADLLASLYDKTSAALLLFNNYDRASQNEQLVVETLLSWLPSAPWLRIIIVGKAVTDPQGKPWESFAAPLIELGARTTESAKQTRPYVFISYARKDGNFVDHELKPTLKEAGLDYWDDTTELQASSAWNTNLNAALKKCDWFLVVISPEAIGSKWVGAELTWALENRPGKILPVTIAYVDPAELDPRLLTIMGIDYAQSQPEGRARLIDWCGSLVAAAQRENPIRGAESAAESIDKKSGHHGGVPAPHSELVAALERGLEREGIKPRKIEAGGGSFPEIDSLRIDFTGVQLTRGFHFPTNAPDNGLVVEIGRFEIVALPIYFDKAPLELRLEAKDAKANLGSNPGLRSLIPQAASSGTVTVQATRAALESLLLTRVAEFAAKHGFDVRKSNLTFTQEGPRAISFRAEITAKVFLMSTTLALTGRLIIDNDLDARLSRLELSGEAMIVKLASNFAQPHLTRLEGQAFPLLALAPEKLKLRDIELTAAESLKVQAQFGDA